MLGSSGIAAWVAHVAFWALLLIGVGSGEVGKKGGALFIALWLAGYFVLPFVPSGSPDPLSCRPRHRPGIHRVQGRRQTELTCAPRAARPILLHARGAPGSALAAFDGSLHRGALDPSGVDGIPHGKGDLLSPHPSLIDRHGAQRAGEHLEFLGQREPALRKLPRAADLRRHDPEVGRAPARAVSATACSVSSASQSSIVNVFETMPRARLQIEDLRPQLQVESGQQEQRDDRGLREIASRTCRP